MAAIVQAFSCKNRRRLVIMEGGSQGEYCAGAIVTHFYSSAHERTTLSNIATWLPGRMCRALLSDSIHQVGKPGR